jgi:hypothetical protein
MASEKIQLGTKVLSLDDLATFVLARLKNPQLPVEHLHPVQQQAVRELTEAPSDKRGTLPSTYKKKSEKFSQTGEIPESLWVDEQPKSLEEFFRLELKHSLLIGENKPYPDMTRLALFGFNEQFKRLNGLTDLDMGILIWVLSRRRAVYTGSSVDTFGFNPQTQPTLIEVIRGINSIAGNAVYEMNLQPPSIQQLPFAQRLNAPSQVGPTLKEILDKFGSEAALLLKTKNEAMVKELPEGDQRMVNYYSKLTLPT